MSYSFFIFLRISSGAIGGSPKFNQALIKNGFESVLVCRIQKDDMIKGYLVWAVRRSLRIWQENECALIFYLAELLAEE